MFFLTDVNRESLIALIEVSQGVPFDEAIGLVDRALDAGFSLAHIVDQLNVGGVDGLIYNTWVRKTFSIEWGPR